MKDQLALKAAGVIFLLVSFLHLMRLIFKIEVIVAGFVLPLWLSFIGFAIAILLFVWMFKAVK